MPRRNLRIVAIYYLKTPTRIFGIAQVRVQFALEHGLEHVRKQVFERGLNAVRRLDIVAGNELVELIFR